MQEVCHGGKGFRLKEDLRKPIVYFVCYLSIIASSLPVVQSFLLLSKQFVIAYDCLVRFLLSDIFG